MRRRFCDRHRADDYDDRGISLVEVIVALGLITVVMTSSAMFFIRSLQGTSLQQQRQGATAVGEQTLEQARAISVIHLLDGRCHSNVDTVWNTAPSDVVDVSSMSPAYSAGNVCGTPTVPVQATVASTGIQSTTNRAAYTVSTYIGTCYQDVAGAESGAGTSCAKTDPHPGADVAMYRIVVDVQWTAAKNESCATSSGCNYVVSTLRQAKTTYPAFNINS